MSKRIKILATLGPKSLNKNFLQFAKKNNISYLRLNMSHIEIRNLAKIINFIRKYNSKTPICIDTEALRLGQKLILKNLLKKIQFLNFLKKKFIQFISQ